MRGNDFWYLHFTFLFCTFTYLMIFNSHDFPVRIDEINLLVAPRGTILIVLYECLFSIFYTRLYTYTYIYII